MRASLVLATWVACVTVAGCNASRSPDEAGGGPSPLAHSVSAALLEQAPVAGTTSFGPGVDVSVVQALRLFSEARVVDETLYVMYYPVDSSHQQIAILSRGVLHPLALPGDHWALTFENDNRLISSVESDGVRDWYELRGAMAVPIPKPASQYYGVPHHVLADGDSCTDGLAGSGSALDDIVEHRRVSILSDAAMARATHGALAKAVGVNCDHFHGKNYFTMDAPGVIFRLDGHDAALVAQGWIEASSEKRILIESGNRFIEAEAP